MLGGETSGSEQKGVMQWTGLELKGHFCCKNSHMPIFIPGKAYRKSDTPFQMNCHSAVTICILLSFCKRNEEINLRKMFVCNLQVACHQWRDCRKRDAAKCKV